MRGAKKNARDCGPGVQGAQHSSLTGASVAADTARVNNAVQHLMIRRAEGPCTAAAFTSDTTIGDPDDRNLLGYRYWRRVGRPFPALVLLGGDVVAWTEPLQRRTARQRCMAALVARLEGWHE